MSSFGPEKILMTFLTLAGWVIATGAEEKMDSSKQAFKAQNEIQQNRTIFRANALLQVAPQNAEAYYNRGLKFDIKGDVDNAIREYTEAIRMNTNEARAFSSRGAVYCKKEMWSQAIADFNEAIRINPQDTFAYERRGIAYDKNHNFDQAIADFDTMIRIDPKVGLPYDQRGFTYCHKMEFEKGIADFKEAIRLNPKSAAAYNNLAWFRATCPVDAIRNGKEAVDAAKEACELTRWQWAEAIDTLAAAYAETGDFEHAIRYEKLALRGKNISQKRYQHMKQALPLYEHHQPYREIPD